MAVLLRDALVPALEGSICKTILATSASPHLPLLCIEHAQICNDVLIIVRRQHRVRWRAIGDIRIKWWLFA